MIPAKKYQYRPDIDGLRALAILLVVLFHAFPTIIPGGYIGVDIFFVISGFLITGIIVREFEANSFSFLEFYARRCRRIVPALLLVILSIWVISWFVLLSDEYRNLGKHLIAASTFTSNILLWQEAGYFDTAAELKPLLHLWSLGVEEQFYVLFPVIVGIAIRQNYNLLTVIATLAAFSFIANLSMISSHAIANFYLLPSRFWELLVGAGLAWIAFKKHQEHFVVGDFTVGKSKHVQNIIALIAMIAIIATAFLLNKSKPYPGWFALLPTTATAVMIYAGNTSWVNRVVLSSRPVVILGLISFPLYLWHWPLLSLTRITGDGDSIYIRISAVLLATLLAWLTWKWFEQPIQRLFSKRKPSFSVIIACLALLSVSAIGWQGFKNSHFKERTQKFAQYQEQLGQTAWNQYQNQDERCALNKWKQDFCRQNGEHPPVAIYGDSHANHLIPGLLSLENSQLRHFIHMGRSGCPPLEGVKSYWIGNEDLCSDFNNRYSFFIQSQPDIKMVIFAAHWPVYTYGHTLGHEQDPERIIEPAAAKITMDRAQILQDGLSRSISLMEKAGKTVVIFMDVPELGFDPASCIDIRPFRILSHTREVCGIEKHEVDSRQSEIRAIVSNLKASHPALKVFDPNDYLCDKQYCWAMKDGVIFYRDDNHLSVDGSKFLAGHFEQWIRAEKVDTLFRTDVH